MGCAFLCLRPNLDSAMALGEHAQIQTYKERGEWVEAQL